MAAQDRSYILLLNHLHNPKTTLALQTIQGALSHHLAALSPSPTPLAATAISSPFFTTQPFTYQKLNALSTAFRHATHFKFRESSNAEKKRGRIESLFKQSWHSAVDQWVKDVVKGLQGGHPALRLASCSGLLLGIEDLKHANKSEEEGEKGPILFEVLSARGLVEDENIVALAEVMDTYAFNITSGTSHGIEEWEKEFQPAGQDVLSMGLIFASQSFPLIPQNKLKVLPLPILSHILTSTICATFKSGSFLSSVSASVTLTPENQVHISPSSAFAQTIQSITSSPLSASISSIARFTANVAALLLDLPSSHLDENMRAVSDCLQSLQDAAKTVERDWISTSLASVTDKEIAADTKLLTKSVWAILKTLLFTILMVSDAALSASVFLPPTPPLPSGLTPSSLALQTLHALSHLAFVISQFGGVTSGTSSSNQSFKELKKTFYLALDILAQGDGVYGDRGVKAEAYVEQACMALNSRKIEGNVAFRQAKETFSLASIEQLVPVLSDECIRNWVWGVCYPHLFDATHRETFESAHSTILAIFASHAQQQQLRASTREEDDSDSDSESLLTWVNRARRKAVSLTRPQLKDRAAGGEGDASSDAASSSPPLSSPRPKANRKKRKSSSRAGTISSDFVQHTVPFYAQCLIENSVHGKLDTSQLRMAYAALVRSACAASAGSDETFSLAWYCLQLLLDTINDINKRNLAASGNRKGKSRARESTDVGAISEENTDVGRLYRLELMLISTLSSLPLSLLSRALAEVLLILNAHPHTAVDGDAEGRRKELVDALFAEILEGVGDREKEFAMSWWYQHRPELLGKVQAEPSVMKEEDNAEPERAVPMPRL